MTETNNLMHYDKFLQFVQGIVAYSMLVAVPMESL